MPISTNSDWQPPGFLEKASNASAACPMIGNCLSYYIAQTHSRKFIESSTAKTAKRSILRRRYPRILGFASSYIDRYTAEKGMKPLMIPSCSRSQAATNGQRCARENRGSVLRMVMRWFDPGERLAVIERAGRPPSAYQPVHSSSWLPQGFSS